MPLQICKTACDLCRARKRKCDGQQPCGMCTKSQDDCSYEKSLEKKRRKRQRIMEHTLPTPNAACTPVLSPAIPSDLPWQQPTPESQLRVLEANSAAIFAKKLGMRMDPTAAPNFQFFAWNLGLNYKTSYLPMPLPITHILPLAKMEELVSVYFFEVHPVYNFMDREALHASITMRWLTPSCGTSASESIDSVLCGVAALGCLFRRSSTPSLLEIQLVQSARVALEYSSNIACPNVDHVVGWVLRVLYLRLTDCRQATWMASCTLMHMIETTRMHLEYARDLMPGGTGDVYDEELRRRIFAVSQLFNTWISLDCGRSKVELRGALTVLPLKTWSNEQITLWHLSESLNIDRTRGFADLESKLFEACALQTSHPMLQLLQCNIGLCIFRRLRALGRPLDEDCIERLLSLADRGLASVEELVTVRSPWWHIVNIPFQVLCMTLVIESKGSMLRLEMSLQSLRLVSDLYGTESAKEAYTMARLLADLQRQRRRDELSYLEEILSKHDSMQHDQSLTSLPIQQEQAGSHTSLEGFQGEIPESWKRIDFNQFFMADYPSLSAFLEI